MPESPKDELVFRYVRDAEGRYRGIGRFFGKERDVERFVEGDRRAWVEFAWGLIRELDPAAVTFVFERPDGTTHKHPMGRWTIERIKSGDLTLEEATL